MKDGFGTRITFAALTFEEKSVKPPGFDGGDAIDITHNGTTERMRQAAQQLIKITDLTASVVYNTEEIDDIKAQINVEQPITVTFSEPAGPTTAVAEGFLQSFEPDDQTRGDQPMAKMKIVYTGNDGLLTTPTPPA